MSDYLIIDDSDIDILIVNRMISKHYPQYNPIVLNDGIQGIEYLRNVIKGKNKIPSFILLDLQMPFMDGFEFLEVYEKELYTILKDIKLIILTSSIHQIDKQKAEKFKSVSAYMVKPFSVNEFKFFI